MIAKNLETFHSASRQFASGEETASAKKGPVEASLSDNGILEVRLNGSVIKIDTKNNLISLNGEPARQMSRTLEEEQSMFNRLSRGAETFGTSRTINDSLTIHESFGATRIKVGDTNVVIAPTGHSSYGVAVKNGRDIYAEELDLPVLVATRDAKYQRDLVS